MNPREAEKLIGGYATGTLTEAERQELFAAALDDQRLFDALADEEALRELLADPESRGRILASLTSRPVVPLWRRSAAMGLAASLLVAVGVGLLLRHGSAPQLPRTSPSALSEETKPTPRMDKQTPPAKPSGSPAKSARPEAPRPLARKAQPPQLPVPEPATAAAPLPPAANMLDRAETLGGVVSKGETRPAKPAAADEARARVAQATTEVVGSQSRIDTSASQAGAMMSMENLAAAPKGRTWNPPPTWAFTSRTDGRSTLKVQWGPGGSLYLLRRDAGRATVLQADASTFRSDGRRESVFTLSLAKGTVLDLYQLPQSENTPAALPESGPIFGFRARIWPPEKKTP